MLKYVICLNFVLFFAFPCWAQALDDKLALNDKVALTLPASYSKNNSTTTSPRVKVTRDAPNPSPLLAYSELKPYTDLQINFPDYWDTYANQPHVTYTYRYRGLRGAIYKQVIRGLDRLYDRALTNSWEQSYLDLSERRRIFFQHEIEAGDVGNRFWEQREYFFDYFPVEKGGHSHQQLTVGERYEVLELGPLGLNNEGRISWSGWRLAVSSERDDDTPSRQLRDNLRPQQTRQNRIRAYSLGITPPRGNLYTGDYFTLSGAVKVGLRLDNFEDNKSSVAGKLELMCYSGPRRKAWLAVNLRGRARPLSNDYRVEISFALLTF